MKTYLYPVLIMLMFTLSASAQQLPTVQFEFGPRSFEVNVLASSQSEDVLTSTPFNSLHYQWVQFLELPSDAARADMSSKGIDFIEYVPNHCYLLAIPSNSSMSYLYDQGIRAIQPMEIATKLDTRILYDEIPDYAWEGDKLSLKILIMPHVNRNAMAQQMERLGAINTELPNHDRYILATASPDAARVIAQEAWVRYVELMDPVGEPESVEGRTIQKANMIDNHLTGAGALTYNGEGIKVLVRDDGDVGPHIDFQGRLWNDPNNGSSGTHGDGVAGVWAACGNLDPTVVAGGSAADVYVIDYLSTFMDNTMILHQDSGVVITNSSYSNGCNAGYTTTTVTVDEMMFDNPTLLHVFSAGNSNNSDCGYGAGNQWGNVTGGHKMGKNVVTVANLNRVGDLESSSSRGPAHDGRIKPDLAGHGAGQRSTNPNNGYRAFGGTSAAAPSTAGNLTQLYQVYEDLTSNTAPAALIKACAMNSAQDLGNAGPDFKFGWGLIHTKRAYDVLANNQYLSSTISNGGNNTHNITVPPGVGQLRIMLYWADPEASASAATALINDLDLTVDDPSSTTLLPHVLDHTPNATLLDLPASTANAPDRLNNVEQVVVTNPVAGTYTVEVDAFTVPQGPQEYYLVYSLIPTGVQLTYPLGGEKVAQGVVERIQWDAFGNTGTFDVEYSTNNGGSWNTIASGVASGLRGLDWTPPSVISANCLVRVTRGGQTDQSTETFFIHDVPTGLSVAILTLDSATISWNAVAGATLYNLYQLGNKKMELIGTTTATTQDIGGMIDLSKYWFSVSANTLPTVGQRAFAVPYIHNVASLCGGCLTSIPVPYLEDFESGLGRHCNFVGDSLDWFENSGSTPSSGTGPSAAQSGNSYLYIEASNPNFPSKTAHLGSPCFDLASCSGATMEFYYHMFGAAMGSLTLEASSDQGASWSAIWSQFGDQGDQWLFASVALSEFCGGSFAYRFVGVTGTDFTSDIAIDNIFIDDGTFCYNPGLPSVIDLTETSAEVTWAASSSAVTYDLELVNITDDGIFTGVPTVSGLILTSHEFTGLTEFTTYDVYVTARCASDSSSWSGPARFTTDGCVNSIPWIDDLDVYLGCSTSGGNQVCDFGGGWTQDNTDGNDWRIDSGGTSSVNTGPDGDNTTGSGNYLYIEASSTFNLTSNLFSPCVDMDAFGDAELTFYYHMYGDDMGTLNVDITTNGGASWTNLWTQTGEVQQASSDPWLKVKLNLTAYSGEVQFRFQGIAGSSWESDMAIDDISINPKTFCPPSLTVTGIPVSGTYATTGLLTSDALIQNLNQVFFSGVLGVEMQSDFEVQVGAEFEANTANCP